MSWRDAARTAALILVMASAAIGQEGDPDGTPPREPGAEATPVASTVADTTPRRPVSPMGAFLRSLVIPGWGQAAVDQPVRGAFYFAMEAASLAMLVKTQKKLDAANRAQPRDEGLVTSRENQREDWIALAVFWSLFSAVDAWVSAQLWGFEGEVVPPPDGSQGLALQVRVPVGGF